MGTINNYANLLQVSNAISIWLGISPPDLFFYAVGAGRVKHAQAEWSTLRKHESTRSGTLESRAQFCRHMIFTSNCRSTLKNGAACITAHMRPPLGILCH